MATDKNKYFKLGIKALSFYDLKSGLQLTPGKPGFITEAQYNGSEKTKNASAQGHIIEIKEDEYNELLEAKNLAIQDAKAKANTAVTKQTQVLINTHGIVAVQKAIEAIQAKQVETAEAVSTEVDPPPAATLKETLQPKIDKLEETKGADLDALATELKINVKAAAWTKQNDKDKREEILDEFNDLK